eukprot:g46352.t1
MLCPCPRPRGLAIRVTVKKVEEGSPVNLTFFMKRALLDSSGSRAADIFCLLDFPSQCYFDMTSRSKKQCEHILKQNGKRQLHGGHEDVGSSPASYVNGLWVYRLYDTKPSDSTVSQSFLSFIMEALDNSTWERLDQPFSLDELTKAFESFEKNKIPGSNGLPAKFYLVLWDIIGQDLLEVYNSMLLSGSMTDYLKVLRIWFGGARACAKSWEERIAKVRQELVFWEHHSLSIEGKILVIR